jgi:hypothetical protein
MAGGNELALPCHGCGAAMRRVMQVEETPKGPAIDVYQCETDGCKLKIDVIYEPAGGLSEAQKTWLEREVARTGAFFPADYRSGGGFGGGLR